MDSPLLCVHPGANTSTSDVYDGIVDGLIANGVKVVEYALDRRLIASKKWLTQNYRSHVRRNGPLKDTPPGDEDILYFAGQGIIERALQADAKWVLVVAGGNVHPAVLTLLRRAGRKIAVLCTESPYWSSSWEQQFVRQADVCWTNERTSVPILRQGCPWTFYLPTAFNLAHHHPPAPDDDLSDVPEYDVVFIGTGFEERIELLSQIDWSGITLGLYGYWNLLPSRHPLRRFVRGKTIANREAIRLYQRAKIGLNLYRTSVGFARGVPKIEGAESLNPRAYELAACGVFQLSDYRAELPEVFGPSVPTFKDAYEANALIHGFVQDAESRSWFTVEAQSRVRSHTYVNRAKQLLADLETYEAAPQTLLSPELPVGAERITALV
jgi:spore maturation protein CgeB